jgi:hypothetical protein
MDLPIKPFGTISNDGSKIIVYRKELVFEVFTVLNDKVIDKDIIDLDREIRATIDKNFMM